MAIGRVSLDDDRDVLGFLCEPAAVRGAADITSFRRLARLACWRGSQLGPETGSAIIAGVVRARPSGGEFAEAAEHRRRAGRPRLRPASNADVPPRDEILDAAAGLFVSQGLAATTTRQIAERVGIRQVALLPLRGQGRDPARAKSVRPSLQVAATLESRCRDDPAAGLYALALTDVRTLTCAPHNIATLYLMPEVQGMSSHRSARSAHSCRRPTGGSAARPPAMPPDWKKA